VNDLIDLEIPNWNKYQGNKKSKEWNSLLSFSIATNFFSDSKIIRLTSFSKLLFVFIIAEAAKQNRDFCTLSVRNTSLILQKRKPNVLRSISELESFQLVNKKSLHKEKKIKEDKIKESKFAPVGASISLVDIWNDNCGQLSKVKGLSDKRNKLCNARLKDNPSADYWSSVIQEISQNSFCLGHNDRGWKANFDWFLKPETHLKVMEGQYRSKSDEKRMALKEIKNSQKENTSESKSKFIRTNKPSEDKKENNNLEVRI